MVEVIELTKKEILATEFDDEKLEQLFSRTYPEAPAVKKTQENTGDKCACRYYGKDVKYELYELLANMNQSYYSNYICKYCRRPIRKIDINRQSTRENL